MSSSKKITCKGTLRQVFICLRPRTHPQPPPLTHLIRVTVYTVNRFVSIIAKFGICTVVGLNGKLVEAKICTFKRKYVF
jgi:hypothetical protein